MEPAAPPEPPRAGLPPPASDRTLARAEAIARLTDRRLLDPVLGLVAAGLGDALGAALGLYVVELARRRGVPRVVLARMLLHLGLDALLGTVPLLGDVTDFFYRANSKNLALLKREIAAPGASRGRPGDWLLVLGALLLFACALALPVALLFGLAAAGRNACR